MCSYFEFSQEKIIKRVDIMSFKTLNYNFENLLNNNCDYLLNRGCEKDSEAETLEASSANNEDSAHAVA